MRNQGEIVIEGIIEKIRSSPYITGMDTRIICIDGCGGAGKTTFAQNISRELNFCPVIHTDDFASPKTSSIWHKRMLTQVLIPLKENSSAQYQRYDWNLNKLAEWITVGPQTFVIIEGVSSCRKEFRPFISFGIYIDTDREIRLQRGLERDGHKALEQWKKWMAEEDAHFEHDLPENFVDLVISGGGQP
ncbi:AAA family ATPase [Bdellovibrionales bacterium]|nr:AAA family ATPase [Bdellovibrionales bacterium]